LKYLENKRGPKDMAKRRKIDISKIAGEKVEQEQDIVRANEREKILEKAANALGKATREDICDAIRKSRDSR
jgi:hypothetical protein